LGNTVPGACQCVSGCCLHRPASELRAVAAPPRAPSQYFHVDMSHILQYLYCIILRRMCMTRPQAKKAAVSAEPERLLQAKLPAELVKALRIHALERETTVKELLARLVREYLERQRPLTKRTP